MNRRQFCSTAALGTAGLLTGRCGGGQTKPNFVFILVDDMGWTGVGCYGSRYYDTPHIDRLAHEGMLFTDAYAASPVCSPTRASVLTGKYPARLHLTDWLPGYRFTDRPLLTPDITQHLEHGEVTLAEALKAHGYATASIGKWHLGDEPHYPETQGFDLNIAGCEYGGPPSYFAPYESANGNRRLDNIEPEREGEYLTDRLTHEAVDFIETNRDRPFFLYLSHYAVHTPIQAKEEYIPKYEARIRPGDEQNNPVYGSMTQSVDDSVGALLAALDRNGLAEDTVVIFMSDNGGVETAVSGLHITSNDPLRGQKGTAYEGGVREPMIVRWPGRIEPGSTCGVPVTSVDFYPTMLAMAGVPLPDRRTVDGMNITPLLEGGDTIERDAIYWHYPHYHNLGATPYSAVRSGGYKLIRRWEDNSVELYNLDTDIGETRNLADTEPAVARRLAALLDAWLEDVGAQVPRPNPDWREK